MQTLFPPMFFLALQKPDAPSESTQWRKHTGHTALSDMAHHLEALKLYILSNAYSGLAASDIIKALAIPAGYVALSTGLQVVTPTGAATTCTMSEGAGGAGMRRALALVLLFGSASAQWVPPATSGGAPATTASGT